MLAGENTKGWFHPSEKRVENDKGDHSEVDASPNSDSTATESGFKPDLDVVVADWVGRPRPSVTFPGTSAIRPAGDLPAVPVAAIADASSPL